MINEEFVEELTKEIEKHQKYLDNISNRWKFLGSYVAENLYDKSMNIKYVSSRNVISIKALYYFVIRHKELSDDEIKELLKQNDETFKFLNKFVCSLDNVIEQMRNFGYMYVVKKYNKEVAMAEKCPKESSDYSLF